MPFDPADAFAWLERHVNLESLGTPTHTRVQVPTLERIERVMALMADPQRQYPIVHVTGTNGKTSTARIIAALLQAKGLSVGLISSPSLERTNERISWNGEPIDDQSFAETLAVIADLEPMLDDGAQLSWFEIVTAAGFRWFADIAVDVAVVEVGMGGRWDATNVADGIVSVVTNVSLDHADYLGTDLAGIAREKSGIVKPGSTLVLGERDPELAEIFRAAGANEVWARDVEFACDGNRVAVGGRLLDLRTPGAHYPDLFLALHGPHQGDNAACALAAAEAFFGAALEEDVVAEAFATVQSPGRLEVVRRQPLVMLDGAHNPAGMAALGAAVEEGFGSVDARILVVGMFRGRDPLEMLTAVDARAYRLVVACPPPSPRAMDPHDIAAAARSLGVEATVAKTTAGALSVALDTANEDDLVLVTGSLYLVGDARKILRTT